MARGRLRREAKAARKGGVLVPHGGISRKLSDLYERLHAHTAFMRNRLLEGKNASSVDANKVRKIMEDFREAGLVAPPTGALIPDLGPREAPIKSAVPTYEFLGGTAGGGGLGAGVGFGGNFGQTQVVWGDGANARSSMLQRGVDPKTMRSVLPYQRSSAYQSTLPYRPPPKRLHGQAMVSNDWLPPWMLYGDQPNQFVKRRKQNVVGRYRPAVAVQMPRANVPPYLRVLGNRLLGAWPAAPAYPAARAPVVPAQPAAPPVYNVPPAPPGPPAPRPVNIPGRIVKKAAAKAAASATPPASPAPGTPVSVPSPVFKKAAAKHAAPATPPPSPPAAAAGSSPVVAVPSPVRKKAAAAVSDATWAARIPGFASMTPRVQANAKRAWSINHP